ncbi:MAG: hypothetical protein Fur0015_03690 [Ignavibacteriales bacterium]
MSKKALVAFLGNPFFDTRVTNLFSSLNSLQIEVKVIGFDWISSRVKSEQNIIVTELDRKSSFGFYFSFMKILYQHLKENNADYYFAEDVYTLPLISLFAKSRKKKLFYNSRELYPFIAGLSKKKLIQFLLAKVEKLFIKSPDVIFVTGDLDAEFLGNYYRIKNILVLRNLPKLIEIKPTDELRSSLKINENEKIILYQGVVFKGRGIQLVINAIKNLSNVHFVVLGDGNQKVEYQKYASDLGVGNHVHFLGSISQEKLSAFTSSADLGVALIENISTSYYYALPGKLFEYIMAEVPVLCSDLPQMKKIVREFNVGESIPIESEEIIQRTIKKILDDDKRLKIFKENCRLAKRQLNWDSEFKKLIPYL